MVHNVRQLEWAGIHQREQENEKLRRKEGKKLQDFILRTLEFS
jgi:hypothetical protein